MYHSKYVTLTTDETHDHIAEAYEAGARLLGDALNEMCKISDLELVSATTLGLTTVPVRSTEILWDHSEHIVIKYKGRVSALILMKSGDKK